MGYPVYKLIRAVNRQYPNNGFINYVDVREDMYKSDDPEKDGVIDEDLRDLINEAIQEVYKDVAIDEVYSFPTVPGQNQYVLPDDCDLRDIQEVTRTFWAAGCPVPPPCGPGPEPEIWFEVTFYPGEATGEMDPIPVKQGDTFTFPECTFTPPEGKIFEYWEVDGEESDMHYQPGDEIEAQSFITAYAIWGATEEVTVRVKNATPTENSMIILEWKEVGNNDLYSTVLVSPTGYRDFIIPKGDTLGQHYSYMHAHNLDNTMEADLPLTTPVIQDTTIPLVDWTIGGGVGTGPSEDEIPGWHWDGVSWTIVGQPVEENNPLDG